MDGQQNQAAMLDDVNFKGNELEHDGVVAVGRASIDGGQTTTVSFERLTESKQNQSLSLPLTSTQFTSKQRADEANHLNYSMQFRTEDLSQKQYQLKSRTSYAEKWSIIQTQT